MKLSLKWLSRLVDLSDLSPEEIRNDLTLSTAEIEGIEVYGGGLEDIRVGHVVECARHPNADKLSLTRVDVGEAELLPIVCGASNVAAGQKVAVVTPGRTLPGGVKIKKAKIRGEVSYGMICSERELGLSDEHAGILVLHPGLKPGLAFTDVVPVRDHVFEIDNKSINHRPDLWGHHGFARELAAIYGRELQPAFTRQNLPERGRELPVVIEDEADCPRFCGLLLEGVAVGPSPDWLRWLLEACGQRAINVIVDVTNFVMRELGEPMHAFDLARLDEAGILARRARPGESISTLDGVKRELTEEDLVVASGERAVSIAGIMGGEGTMVDGDTKEVFLEAANWHPGRIRRSSARLGLRSDASARFEKALDPALAEAAIHRFVEILAKECPGMRAAGPLSDPARWRPKPLHIRLRRQRLALKLGVRIEDERVKEILESLEFETSPDQEGFEVGVPPFRATRDIRIEDDLIEEVGRMFRYDKIPEQPLVSTVEVPPREPELYLARRLVALAVTQIGCHEVYNYSFVPDALLEAVRASDHAYARLTDPVAPESARMRRHVLPSLLHSTAPALRCCSEVRLVEQGKGYQPEHRDEHGLPHEVLEVAFVWSRRDGAHPYPELRSHILSLLRRTGHEASMDEKLGLEKDRPWTHPGWSVAITRGQRTVGLLSALHPIVARNLELPASTAIASLDLRAMLAGGRSQQRFASIPRFPSQPVDVALLVPAATRVAEIAQFLAGAGKKLVRSVELFEVYRGAGLPAGKKSLNFTVTLGAPDRTLTAKDEERYLSRVREGCASVGAELRG